MQTTLALKKVFQVDCDFQERMFARQIAVMKGQAWNVVETLKTPDHGPLELTRRARVCVWDDLVDVPVAVPMRATSSELRRNPQVPGHNRQQSMDEADIASSAPAPRVPVEDLLGFASPPANMPNPGRFEISTPLGDDAHSPNEEHSHEPNLMDPAGHKALGGDQIERPPGYRGPGSYQGPVRALNMYEPARQQQPHKQRRYSFATSAVRRNSNTISQQIQGGESHHAYDDDVEGDLGYAAAEGQMGNQRKVIVERLEQVKGRNPVFACW